VLHNIKLSAPTAPQAIGEVAIAAQQLAPTPLTITYSTSPKMLSVDADVVLSPSTCINTSAPNRLFDLPTELLHIVLGYLWVREDYKSWYDQYERLDVGGKRDQRLRMRKDVLAFSSGSKDLRQRIFCDWLLKEVVVKLTDDEAWKLAALSPDVRGYIK
jgi:hypothetical protein